jgi:hypothetical protein
MKSKLLIVSSNEVSLAVFKKYFLYSKTNNRYVVQLLINSFMRKSYCVNLLSCKNAFIVRKSNESNLPIVSTSPPPTSPFHCPLPKCPIVLYFVPTFYYFIFSLSSAAYIISIFFLLLLSPILCYISFFSVFSPFFPSHLIHFLFLC